ncbi:MAG: hypothetical protein AB1758_27965 [Candidatus Eremiobacterota bacterium]
MKRAILLLVLMLSASAHSEELRFRILHRGDSYDVDRVREVLQRRLDALGQRGEVRLVSAQEVLVEVPALQERDRLVEALTRPGRLEIQLFDEGGWVTALDGRMVASAAVERGEYPALKVVMNAQGRDRLAQVTRARVGQRMRIVVDGKLLTEPVIQEAILGGEAVITGHFTPAELEELAVCLGAGWLPVDLEPLQNPRR